MTKPFSHEKIIPRDTCEVLNIPSGFLILQGDVCFTKRLCLAAVKQTGYALEYVPKALQAQVKKAAGIK